MPRAKRPQSGGYTPEPENVAVLKFADGQHVGAQIRCSLDVSTGIILEFSRIGSSSPIQFDSLIRKFGRFYLLGWNIEIPAGEPIPATGEGMTMIPTRFALQIINAWSDAVVGVSRPLVLSSSNGQSYPEASIPMAPL